MKLKYITGRGGDALGGLSKYLAALSLEYRALALDQAFLAQTFPDQVLSVRAFCGDQNSSIIANSHGAYLLLQALIDQPSLDARMMLLSPVLGRANSKKRMLISRPPGEKALKLAILEGRLGLPNHLEILTGSDDDSCDAALAVETAAKLGAHVCVLQNEGHIITPSKVETAVNAFLWPKKFNEE